MRGHLLLMSAVVAVSTASVFGAGRDWASMIAPAVFPTASGQETVGGTSYNTTTTIGTPTSNSLLSALVPNFNDNAAFDGIEEQISSYDTIIPPQLAGQRRFATETATALTPTTNTYTFSIRALAASANTPADLWPDGLANTTAVPLTDASYFVGIGLPANLGGTDPVNVVPGTTVTAASMFFVTDGIADSFSFTPAQVAVFFTNVAGTWNGVFGVRFTGGATNDPATPGPDVDSLVGLSITTVGPVIPEPTTLAALAGVALTALRRRR